jgi:hypothetical protein
MHTLQVRATSIYVDRDSQKWIVRDSEGQFWALAPSDRPWDDRSPFIPTEETSLEPVPGHYRSHLGLPH